MQPYFYQLKLVARLHDEINWTPTDEETVTAHFERLKSDYEKGKVLHVGRSEETGKNAFGIVVYLAENDQEAEQYMLQDPAVINGQMQATYTRYKLIFR